MAFENSHEISEEDGSLVIDFVDNTGNYDADTNPTGYGSPNVAINDIILATIIVKPYGFLIGWLFTFTIASGTITACTVTAPDGTVTNIFDDLEFTSFPFSEDEPFKIIGEWLGFGEDSQIPASAYNFEYTIATAVLDESYTASSDELIVGTVCCCVRNASADLDARDCEECMDEKVENSARATIMLDSAIWAMENGEVDKSYANLMEAKRLCEGGCASC